MPGVPIFIKCLYYLQQTPNFEETDLRFTNNNYSSISLNNKNPSPKASRDLFARRVLLTSSISFLYGLTPYIVEEYAHAHNQYSRFKSGLIFTKEENTMLLRRSEWQSKMSNVILLEDDPPLEFILYVQNVPTLKFLKNLHIPSCMRCQLAPFARLFGISPIPNPSIEPPRLESLSLSFFQLFVDQRIGAQRNNAGNNNNNNNYTVNANPLSHPDNFMKVLIKFASASVPTSTGVASFAYGRYLRALDCTACCLMPDALFTKLIENTPNLEYIELKNAVATFSSTTRLTPVGCCAMLRLVGRSLRYLGLEHAIATPAILEHIGQYCAPYNRLQVLKLENMIPHYIVGGSQDAIHKFTDAAVAMFEEFNKGLRTTQFNDDDDDVANFSENHREDGENKDTMSSSSLRVLTISRSSFVSNRVFEVVGRGTIGSGLVRFEMANPGSEIDPNSLLKLFFGSSLIHNNHNHHHHHHHLSLHWLNLGNFEYRTNRAPAAFNDMFRKLCVASPYIRKLDLFFNTVIVTDETLRIISEELFETLEEIDLDGCRSLTNEGVLLLARSCKQLKFLSCIGHDELFSDEFLSIIGDDRSHTSVEPTRRKFEKLILGKQHRITREGILNFAKSVGASLKALSIKLQGETRESAMLLDAAIRKYCPFVDVLVDFA